MRQVASQGCSVRFLRQYPVSRLLTRSQLPCLVALEEHLFQHILWILSCVVPRYQNHVVTAVEPKYSSGEIGREDLSQCLLASACPSRYLAKCSSHLISAHSSIHQNWCSQLRTVELSKTVERKVHPDLTQPCPDKVAHWHLVAPRACHGRAIPQPASFDSTGQVRSQAGTWEDFMKAWFFHASSFS